MQYIDSINESFTTDLLMQIALHEADTSTKTCRISTGAGMSIPQRNSHFRNRSMLLMVTF
jgi:hypothetical protein